MEILLLIISDRSYQKIRDDITGPTMIDYLEKKHQVHYELIPDDLEMIKNKMLYYSGEEKKDLILSCGGTGFSPRDNTPEATRAVIKKEAPGIAELIRSENAKIHKNSYLSRGICGIIDQTIIINLPGSPHGALECFKIAEPLLAHAHDMVSMNINNCFKKT